MSAFETMTGTREQETQSEAHASAPRSLSQGVRAIIAYKTVKASAQLGSAVLLFGLWPFGLPQQLANAASILHAHATHMWAIHLSAFLVKHATERASFFLLLALAIDGAFTAFEVFALRRAYAWAPWLVVVATSSLLPFEIIELRKHLQLSRFAILLVNAAIAAYLARGAMRERRSA